MPQDTTDVKIEELPAIESQGDANDCLPPAAQESAANSTTGWHWVTTGKTRSMKRSASVTRRRNFGVGSEANLKTSRRLQAAPA